MSFTAEVKDELARVPPTCSHCEKATLAALVRIEGTLFFSGQGTYRIEIATDVPSVARLIIKLLHELYHLKTELTVRRSVLHKTPNYLIEVPAQPHLADALRDMGVLSEEGGLELGIKEGLVAKECCTAAYLRGAFLGSGFVLTRAATSTSRSPWRARIWPRGWWSCSTARASTRASCKGAARIWCT